jgi:putative transposase
VGRVSEGKKAERFAFIAEHHAYFGVRYLCRQLKVSFQGYHKWLHRPPSVRDQVNQKVLCKIERLFQEHDGNYGSPRIHAALVDEGEVVNHKRVERLMRESGLVGKAGRLYRRKPLPVNPCITVPNRRLAKGMPSGPDQQWVGDVTYLKLRGTWQYLSVVMDLYSRQVIGWCLSGSRTVDLTLAALAKAFSCRHVEAGLIFHSDRGSEYGAKRYQQALADSGIVSSMNRVGVMNNNVYIETFFQTFKTECFKGIDFRSVKELREVIAEYLDDYYNTRRHHSALGYKTPSDYERMAA